MKTVTVVDQVVRLSSEIPQSKLKRSAAFTKAILFVSLFLFSVNHGWGQTAVFWYQNTTATIPSGWTLTNNVTTNVVDRSTYLLLDAGNP